MNRESFEELVEKALESLPPEFAERLDNVAITVADRPSRRQLSTSHVDSHSTLLGLYEGVPQTQRGTEYGMVLPDRITIFQESIESVSNSDAEIVSTVRRVVLHEIAHHFGISDARLDELEGRADTNP